MGKKTLYVGFAGYRFRFRIRSIKNKKRDAKGKMRGRYEGEYVYVEIRTVGTMRGKRDQYIGPVLGDAQALTWVKDGGAQLSSSTTKRAGKERGQKQARPDALL